MAFRIVVDTCSCRKTNTPKPTGDLHWFNDMPHVGAMAPKIQAIMGRGHKSVREQKVQT